MSLNDKRIKFGEFISEISKDLDKYKDHKLVTIGHDSDRNWVISLSSNDEDDITYTDIKVPAYHEERMNNGRV